MFPEGFLTIFSRMPPTGPTSAFASASTFSPTSSSVAPSFESLPMSVKAGNGMGIDSFKTGMGESNWIFVPDMSSLSITTREPSSSFFSSSFFSSAATFFSSSFFVSSFFSSPMSGLNRTLKLRSQSPLMKTPA